VVTPQPGGATRAGIRRPWAGRRVLLGVTGGIAAYKTVQLARDLTRLGAEVDVVMTRSARAFVGELSFEGVTGRSVYSEILAPGHALDHIRLGRDAQVVCIAPATADFLARAARGRADDLLAAALLVTRAPVLICPAMNDAMWDHAATQANVARLSELGYGIVGPAEGPLAYGEGSGPGRMEEPPVLLEHIGRALVGDTRFAGRRVLVTAGPTREAVDPVRFLSNRSSGRMGFALAAAAWRRGADVDLVCGPTSLAPPPGPRVHAVETGEQMQLVVQRLLADADVLLMAAAPADFRPRSPATAKIKKESAPDAIALEPAVDILTGTVEDRKRGCIVVGFALETEDGDENARRKLRSKAMDMVVLNQTGPASGFETPTNEVTLLDASGESETLPTLPKDEVAERILDRLERRLPFPDESHG
jgi:phosphopantothenoylcysteine decarboxylase / phosphopantothenate---cysteine ligase